MNPKEPQKSARSSRPSDEHTCSHCLYFHAINPERRPLEGNCGFYKEWIENGSFYTCSEMSALSLNPKGIYRLEMDGRGRWIHIRREGKVRSRLFLVLGGKDGRGEEGG